MLRTSPLIDKAKAVAQAAHEAVDQRRKYNNLPYFMHPHAVAVIVQEAGGTDMQIAWALLHDTVEDTNETFETLDGHFAPIFGHEVAAEVVRGVYFLTDISTKADGRREIRKEMDRQHNWSATPDVKSVKLADMLHNGADIWSNDPEFAVVFMREKGLSLTGMLDADLPVLVIRSQDMILQYMLDPNRGRSTKRPV